MRHVYGNPKDAAAPLLLVLGLIVQGCGAQTQPGSQLAASSETKDSETRQAGAEPTIVFTDDVEVNNSADGGLRPVVGVHNIQVYRSNRTQPEHQDGLTHTYLHAPMLAYWRGKFYLDYLSAPVNEHDPDTPTSIVSSEDGVHWSAPELLFPSIPISDGTLSVTHQRTSFYVAPNDRLLATAYHGIAPRPNAGEGVGRVVREIYEDGSFGPIYFIRLNSHEGWDANAAKIYPLYSESSEAGFVEACESLLANKLVTAQWWEEDRTAKDNFYRAEGQALSYYRLPDGNVAGIWKGAATGVTEDEGETWTMTGQAKDLYVNQAKYWMQRTSDDRYAMVFNPTSRLRHPLAIATSDNGKEFDDLLVVHDELPVQRFPGKYKNMGPQYVRGILEGNGAPPAGDMWVAYSVNKEDIWVSRIPVPVRSAVAEEASAGIADDFSANADGELPSLWNLYRPLWAPVEVRDTGGAQGLALSLTDEDPYDYASATRVFPDGRSALIRFKLYAEQTDGRFEIDIESKDGQRPAQIAFTEDGKVEARHEGIWKPGGDYAAREWIDVEIDVNPGEDVDRYQLRINGEEVLYRAAYFTDYPPTVERITFRTGRHRPRGEGGHDLPGADAKAPRVKFWIDDLTISANRK